MYINNIVFYFSISWFSFLVNQKKYISISIYYYILFLQILLFLKQIIFFQIFVKFWKKIEDDNIERKYIYGFK